MKTRYVFFLLLISPIGVFSQELNQVILDTILNRDVLTGYCNREAFTFEEMAPGFSKEYQSYDPDATVLDYLKEKLSAYDITIVMASWCSDSKEQVPRFYRILDMVNFNTGNIRLIFVDRGKKAGEVDIEDLKVEKVPTFILYSKGKEAGRIIETPSESLEKDMMSIIASDDQK